MERAITLTAIIFIWLTFLNVCANVSAAETQPWLLARHRKPTKLTTKIPLLNKTTLIVPTVDNSNDESDKEREFHHPAAVQKLRLIERYDKRALDGHYEYRYVLSNGDVRYERAYWKPVGHTKVLARKGYYSYPLPNHQFHTVFYTADHNGFREDESSYTRKQPVLPRSLEITVTDAISEKPVLEKKKKKINRKPNWTPVTTTILQKGRNAAVTQETKIGTVETRTEMGTEENTEANTSLVDAKKTSASRVTNRPQINTEDTRATKNDHSLAPEEIPEIITEVTRAISASIENDAINPIKVESVQMATMTTKTEQPKAIDSTTVLSVD